MTRKRVLLTGSSGMIGSALAERLAARGFVVRGVDRRPNRWIEWLDDRTLTVDLTEATSLDRLPDSVDLIVHLAANARVHKLVGSPQLAKENIDATYTIVEYARRTGADLLFASSREVYGSRDQPRCAESESRAADCASPYAASKLSGEALVAAYRACYGIQTCIVRLSNVYGRYDATDRVIPRFIASAQRGQPLTVYGTDKLLDCTYLDDCLDGITEVVERFEAVDGETINIASGAGTTLQELAATIIDETDSESEIETKPERTGEIRQYVADISRATQLLDYEPAFDLDAGIRNTVAWYRQQPELYDEILG